MFSYLISTVACDTLKAFLKLFSFSVLVEYNFGYIHMFREIRGRLYHIKNGYPF